MNVLADLKVAGRDKPLSEKIGERYGQKATEEAEREEVFLC